MDLAHQAAFLRMCPRCGLHGVIVYPGGSTSPIFATKEMAIRNLTLASEVGCMSESESEAIREAIAETNMAEKGGIIDMRANMLNLVTEDVTDGDIGHTKFYSLVH